MTEEQRQKATARAERLGEFLEANAWHEEIVPELEKLRQAYLKLLVKAALGELIPIGQYTLTTEQLAGRVYGLDTTQQLIEKILKHGKDAAREYLAELPS